MRPEFPAEARDRNRTLRVVVNSAERAQIEANAAATSMSVSAFLRAVGMGFEPKSTLDCEAVLKLCQLAGDQGRLGGLLKLWLRERPGDGASEHDVSLLLSDLTEIQALLRQQILSL